MSSNKKVYNFLMLFSSAGLRRYFGALRAFVPRSLIMVI